ncbi:MAG: hypothetical protein CM15mP45_07510 [Deltaproteobacteria bacterium]|nr:MAG: hypothetical protein CM15mP45_07510 [Deltaproteobacteria bacterium]
MNSENQFETIILKILESDPQLLVAASVVLVILIVIGVFLSKPSKNFSATKPRLLHSVKRPD